MGNFSKGFATVDKYYFGIGAAIASFLFFFLIGYLSKYLSKYLQNEIIWKKINPNKPFKYLSDTPYEYIHDPVEIYRRSFNTVRNEAPLDQLTDDMAEVAIRLIHACGMPDIASDLRYHTKAVQAGRTALNAGAPVLADAEMVAVRACQLTIKLFAR